MGKFLVWDSKQGMWFWWDGKDYSHWWNKRKKEWIEY